MNFQYPITITNIVKPNSKCFDWMQKSYPITIVLQDGEEITGITKINKIGKFMYLNDNVIIRADLSFSFKDPDTKSQAIVSCRDSFYKRLTNYVGYNSDWLKWCPKCGEIKPLNCFDYNGRDTGEERDQSECSKCRSR